MPGVGRRTKELIQEFGVVVFLAKIFQSTTKKMPGIKNIAGKWKYSAITGYLYKENKDLINAYNTAEHDNKTRIGKYTNVYVMWWQGFDVAPEIVKVCVESIRTHIGDNKLILLDKANWKEHVRIDSKYETWMNEGRISITQLSDIIRLNLLFQNGGCWIDSTYLVSGILPDWSNYRFFTVRHGLKQEYPMSKGLWTGSIIAFSKGADELKLIISMYERYFNNRTILIDYLLIDYVFAAFYDNSRFFQNIVNSVPVNNEKINELSHHLNEPWDEMYYHKIIGNTTLHKLNRRLKLKKTDSNGKETIYGHFCQCNLEKLK